MNRQFDKNIYTSISLTKLTIFAINEIAKKGEECAYARVVKECFMLFPNADKIKKMAVSRNKR